MAGGTCLVCDKKVPAKKMQAHLLGHFGGGGKGGACLVRANGGGPYWLYARVSGKAKLSGLDDLLRSVWVECCGHLSSFSDGNVTYLSMSDGFGDPREKTMKVNAVKVLAGSGGLGYTYDFGTSTELGVEFVCMCSGAGMKKSVELAARNAEIKYDCSECGAKGAAAEICTECMWDDEGGGMMCAECAKKHDDEDFLPVANSPRMGMCGYTG